MRGVADQHHAAGRPARHEIWLTVSKNKLSARCMAAKQAWAYSRHDGKMSAVRRRCPSTSAWDRNGGSSVAKFRKACSVGVSPTAYTPARRPGSA